MTLGPISVLPNGLLDIFGLRTLGEYPRTVAETYVPTFDISKLVLSIANCEVWTGEIELLGLGSNRGPFTFTATLDTPADIQVPAREAWLIVEWEVILTMFSGGSGTNTAGPIGVGFQRTNSYGLGMESFPRDAANVLPSVAYVGGTASASTWSIAKGITPWILGPMAKPSALFMGDGEARASSGDATNIALKFHFMRLRA